jgi:hypothetical protein
MKKEPLTPVDLRFNLENDLIDTKRVTFFVLAIFIFGQAIISYLVAAFLTIALVLLVVSLWFLTGHDGELLRIILHYYIPALFP